MVPGAAQFSAKVKSVAVSRDSSSSSLYDRVPASYRLLQLALVGSQSYKQDGVATTASWDVVDNVTPSSAPCFLRGVAGNFLNSSTPTTTTTIIDTQQRHS